ncbi:MAG TPA: rhomboid family intramembrane serine protease [Gemmatimonadota bacterium]|nr:rhomboid family intramembrane serine protease [Gemmatimonadota bacterium]
MTLALIGLNGAVFAYELSLGPALERFMVTHGVVPARLVEQLGRAASWPDAAGSIVTSMFLHGGWLHLIFNLWFLWIFGDNVEDRLGRLRYLLLYFVTGAAATLAHVLSNTASTIPTVGASGAIAGVLGAYLVTYPRARVTTLIPVFIFIHIVELPAWVVLGMWFALQFLSGALSLATTQVSAGGVAWWAHIGGFAAGALLMPILSIGRRRGRRAAG